jgi:hypothetical protein
VLGNRGAFAFVYRKTDNWDEHFININGTTFGPYKAYSNVVFSGDGKRFSFRYARDKSGKWFTVIDGKQYGPYGNQSNFRFSPDGRQFGFTFEQGTQKKSLRNGTGIAIYRAWTGAPMMSSISTFCRTVKRPSGIFARAFCVSRSSGRSKNLVLQCVFLDETGCLFPRKPPNSNSRGGKGPHVRRREFFSILHRRAKFKSGVTHFLA